MNQPTSKQSGPPPTVLGRFRWVICALLFFACVVNYLDRQVLGLLKPDLMKLLGWTEKDYGLIAICFQASYAVGQVAFGPLLEWFGTKTTYAFSIVLWSLAAMSHALARTVFGFGVARVRRRRRAGIFPVSRKRRARRSATQSRTHRVR